MCDLLRKLSVVKRISVRWALQNAIMQQTFYIFILQQTSELTGRIEKEIDHVSESPEWRKEYMTFEMKCDISTKEGVHYAIDNKLFTEFCHQMVANAVDILEQIIAEVKSER